MMETDQTIREIFSRRLKTLRKSAGFKSARSLAERLEIDENRYTRYERAEVEPNLQLIGQICETLSVTPNELFGYAADIGDTLGVRSASGNAPGFGESGASATYTAGPGGMASAVVSDQPDVLFWKLAEALAKIERRQDNRDSGQGDGPDYPYGHLQAGQLTLDEIGRASEYYREISADPFAFAASVVRKVEAAGAGPAQREAIAQLLSQVTEAAISRKLQGN